jgi:hypothetical protein
MLFAISTIFVGAVGLFYIRRRNARKKQHDAAAV